MSKREVTLSDVAEGAGVSLAAASRALNGKDGVRPEVRKHIQQIAHELNYRPNRAAQYLAGGRTRVIGLLLKTECLHGDVYAASLLEGFVNNAVDVDQSIILIGDSQAPNVSVRKLVRDGIIDGVVISAVMAGDRWVEELLDADFPVVLVGLHPKRADVCVIDVENTHSSAAVVGHMLDSGCERIAMIAGREGRVDVQLRLVGYQIAHNKRGQQAPSNIVFQGDLSRRSGYELAETILAAGVDGVFCANDEMAVGLHIALSERGVRVPEDISLAGFDRTAALQFGAPDLTSVTQPFGQLARTAMASLDAIIDGQRPPSATITPEIHWGNTTAPHVDLDLAAAGSELESGLTDRYLQCELGTPHDCSP